VRSIRIKIAGLAKIAEFVQKHDRDGQEIGLKADRKKFPKFAIPTASIT
jgi:hypothetical protein